MPKQLDTRRSSNLSLLPSSPSPVLSRINSRRVALLTMPSASNDDDSMESDSEHKNELNGASKDNLNNPSSRAGIEDENGSNSDESEEAGEDEYVVEAIRGHIFVKGAPRYEVKWQGYPEAENTWESEANLQ